MRTPSASDSPEIEQLLLGGRARARRAIVSREARAEATLSLGLLAAATGLALAAPPAPGAPPLLAAVMVAAYAAVSRVRFEMGSGYMAPTQLVLVPMLYGLAPGLVPAAVALGLVLGRFPDVLRGQAHPSRLLACIGNAWHSVGPAAVLALAALPEPELEHWPVYLAALLAQFAVDFLASSVGEWIALGVPPGLQARVLGLVYLFDTALAPVGLLAALAADESGLAFLLPLPIVGLLSVLARERRARIDHAVELSSAYRGTAMLLGDVVEADDAYTGSHSRSVVDLALAVADELGLDARQRRAVEFGALLHDVGKITIPKAIINKPGPLDPDERELINTHTIAGERMLQRVGGVLAEAGTVVRASHEHYDGRGYPDGLAGAAIPIEARIVACCDAYSAMTTDRAYRSAMSVAEALAEVQAHAGTQFDPEVAAALVTRVTASLAPALSGGPACAAFATPAVSAGAGAPPGAGAGA